jgi:hypothetical protein
MTGRCCLVWSLDKGLEVWGEGTEEMIGDYEDNFSSHHPCAERGIGSERLGRTGDDVLVDVAGGDGGGVGSGKHGCYESLSVCVVSTHGLTRVLRY